MEKGFKAMKHSEVLLKTFVNKLMLGNKIRRLFNKSYPTCRVRSHKKIRRE